MKNKEKLDNMGFEFKSNGIINNNEVRNYYYKEIDEFKVYLIPSKDDYLMKITSELSDGDVCTINRDVEGCNLDVLNFIMRDVFKTMKNNIREREYDLRIKRRGFKLVSKEQYKNTDAELPYENLVLPKRSTALAAGYDIISTKSFTLQPGQSIIIPTGFKAYMQPGEMLALYPRSGVGFKYEIQLANTVGIGDGDYYNCESNEGHYMLKLVNRGNKFWTVKSGERIAQAIFTPILLADGDSFEDGKIRTGGFGSTNK